MALPTPAPLDASLIRDIRAAGIPYEPEIDRLPFPVRHQAALHVALGHACIEGERHWRWPHDTLAPLRRRILAALGWIEALGKRSTCPAQRSWFERRPL